MLAVDGTTVEGRLADLSTERSASWGIVGSIGYALAFLLISYAAEYLGVDTDRQQEPDAEDDDVGGRWWSDLTWMLLAAAIVVRSVLSAAKTIAVALVFAAFVPPSLGRPSSSRAPQFWLTGSTLREENHH